MNSYRRWYRGGSAYAPAPEWSADLCATGKMCRVVLLKSTYTPPGPVRWRVGGAGAETGLWWVVDEDQLREAPDCTLDEALEGMAEMAATVKQTTAKFGGCWACRWWKRDPGSVSYCACPQRPGPAGGVWPCAGWELPRG